MNYIDTHMNLFAKEDTPLSHDFWGAAWCVGTVVGRSQIIDLPTPIFLNPYIYMVSRKGFGKEQRVIEVCRDLVQAVMPINPLAEKQLTVELRRSLNGQVAVAELAYGGDNQHRAISTMHDLAACPPEYKETKNPYVTILTTVEPERANKLEAAWDHILFVSRKGKKEKAGQGFIDLAPAIEELKEIYRYARQDKPLVLSPDAQSFLDNYYRTTKGTEYQPYPELFGRYERGHITRLAGIIAISTLSRTINTEQVIAAIDRVLDARTFGTYLFASASYRNPIGAEKLRSQLSNAPSGIGHKALYYTVKTWLRSYEFNGLLELLRQHGMISMFHMGARGGRVYVASSKLKNDAAWNIVKQQAGFSNIMEEDDATSR